MSYLEIHNLHKRFITPGGREVHALRNISFKINRGDILCVIGPNGAGKTTLLNCLRQIFPWDEGDIRIDGQPLGNHKINIVSVLQEVGLGIMGSMTPMENLSLVFSKRPGFLFSLPKRRFERQIHEFLEESGLKKRFDSFENTPVSDLSGGQRQQVAIMMAAMRRPNLLLLDEFVANLDTTVRQEILSWIQSWILKNNITTLMVTHDRELAANWGNWILELSDGDLLRLERVQRKEKPKNG